MTRSPTILLLSPADLKGVRAKQLTSPRATFAAAQAYRSADGVAIADGFSFMSALYFRGKIAYARRFRHGTTFLRWRPDKEPRACTFDQLRPRTKVRSRRTLAI